MSVSAQLLLMVIARGEELLLKTTIGGEDEEGMPSNLRHFCL
jgi:hypothetical protein